MLLIVHGIFILLFLTLAAVFFRGKGAFLIAGYNTASPEEKANYDESALCHCMGRLMLALAACWAVIALSAVFDAMILLWVGLALFFLTVVTGVIYRNTSKTVRRK